MKRKGLTLGDIVKKCPEDKHIFVNDHYAVPVNWTSPSNKQVSGPFFFIRTAYKSGVLVEVKLDGTFLGWVHDTVECYSPAWIKKNVRKG